MYAELRHCRYYVSGSGWYLVAVTAMPPDSISTHTCNLEASKVVPLGCKYVAIGGYLIGPAT